MDPLELQGGIAIPFGIGFLVVGAVIKGKGEVVLLLGHLHLRRIGQGQEGVPLVGRVVIDHDTVHLAGLVVGILHAQDVSVDTVVERPGGDFDLLLGLADIVSERVDFVVGQGHQVVQSEEGADADAHRGDDEWGHDPEDGDTGRFHGQQLVVLTHLPEGHHGCQQGGKREGERQDGAAAPHQELEDDFKPQALADEFVDIEPEEV